MFVGLSLLRLTVPVSAETVVGRPSTAGVTRWGWVPSLVTPTLNAAVCPAFTVAFRAVLFTNSVLPCGLLLLMDSASWTALSVFTKPAPWWSAGAPRSVAVLTMIRSTSAGDGALPPWVFMYASMTSAAVAEVSGQDALVPPAAQIGGGLVPWSMSAQPKNALVSLLHSDQPRSPGATTSTVCGLNSVTPSELSAVMLLFSQPPGTRFVPKRVVCRYTRKVVVPPTAITPGVVAGEPMLLNGPASPLLATTVTPAATAAWSASDTGSSCVFGIGFPPIDSFRMFTWSCCTAHWTAWMICELKNPALDPATFSTARLAPGAMPSILMLHPAGSGCAGLTNPDRS